MNMNKLIRDQNVGTRFIASTAALIEPGPGRDKSRPYIPSSFLKVHYRAPTNGWNVGSESLVLPIPGERDKSRPYKWPGKWRTDIKDIHATN